MLSQHHSAAVRNLLTLVLRSLLQADYTAAPAEDDFEPDVDVERGILRALGQGAQVQMLPHRSDIHVEEWDLDDNQGEGFDEV